MYVASRVDLPNSWRSTQPQCFTTGIPILDSPSIIATGSIDYTYKDLVLRFSASRQLYKENLGGFQGEKTRYIAYRQRSNSPPLDNSGYC